MQNSDSAICNYFRSPDDSFWQWQDNGESITWKDNKTIAFAEELTILLQHMVPYGLPRFGSLLLLIASTRENWAEDGTEAGILSGLLNSISQENMSPHTQGTELLKRVLTGLQKVRQLDNDLRTTMDAKKALVEIVFEGQESKVLKSDTQAVADAIRPGLLALLASTPELVLQGYGPILLLQDLALLAQGLNRIHPEAVRLRLATGLTSLPSPDQQEILPEELVPCDQARGLIEELLETKEYHGIAKVAKQLLASATLPRKLSESVTQELGGFSDIANRGTPDRLLLSELAQDGLTLAVRVAMNEALYLHREVPPSTPQIRREILIDVGVRTWGIPRVMATSAALALAATTPRSASIGVWRGSGASLCEVDLTTKQGLIDHLSALEPDPHLGEFLPEFSRRVESSNDPAEVILLVPEDVFSDSSFMQALRHLDLSHLYIATVSRSGEFRLTERRPHGEKLIRRAQIDIESLFAEEQHLVESSDLDRFPAIFRTSPFPLHLPHELDAERSWYLDSWGALSITGDGRLMRWTETGRGGEQLSEQIPKGKLWWASPTCFQGHTCFVYGTAQKPVLFRVDLSSGRVEQIPLQTDSISGVIYHNGALFGFSRNSKSVSEVNTETGAVVSELAIPNSLRRVGGRFFVDSFNKWYALSHDGQSATIDALPDFKKSNPSIICVWEASGIEGQIALTRKGHILTDENAQIKQSKPSTKLSDCVVEWVSSDGLVVRGRCTSGSNSIGKSFVIDLHSDPSLQLSSYYPPIEHRIQKVATLAPIRKRFKSIGIDDSGHLTLVSFKGQHLVFCTRQGMPLFSPSKKSGTLQYQQLFTEIEPNDIRYRLSKATWQDGSKAVLDSRGLLHLKPANREVPEITIVLTEGELTVWCSDSRNFGKDYFFAASEDNPKPAIQRRKVFADTISKFVEGIRATS